jgi:hypothetical protein
MLKILLPAALLVFLSPAGLLSRQAEEAGHVRADVQRLVVHADGSLVYIEPVDETLVNRVEFTNRHRPTLEIFLHDGASDRRITILDYDPDQRPDFLRIERTDTDGNVEAVSFYRGPMHKVHEEGHLEHALLHSFVRKDSSLTREIRERLAAMRRREIPAKEIGVFSGYSLFAPLDLPVIQSAFDAADSLFAGIAEITNAPILRLREMPQLLPRYRSMVDALLNINPHTLGNEDDRSAPR